MEAMKVQETDTNLVFFPKVRSEEIKGFKLNMRKEEVKEVEKNVNVFESWIPDSDQTY